jgi:mono/diheme cytochrome c family protein
VKRVVVGIVAAAIVVAGAAAIAVYGGFIPVDARRPDPAWVRGLLTTVRDHSIERAAEGIRVPPLDDPAKVREGLEHYAEMCAGCHGAPGVERSEAGKGLNPKPPLLYKHPMNGDEEAAETFWVVKNGIRMTGMPAFGPTHDDAKIWAIVSLLEKLPAMSAGEYAREVASLPGEGDRDDGGAATER